LGKTEGNRRNFFDWLGKEPGYEIMDDWYRLTLEDIHVNGGQSIVKAHFSDSALTTVRTYPDHDWMPWKSKEFVSVTEKKESRQSFFQLAWTSTWLCKT